jgi:hypothetical protein
MADEIKPESKRDEKNKSDEVALDLMKFIAQSTGYGKGSPAAGFSGGKTASRTPEEYTEALLELFHRCRRAVEQPGGRPFSLLLLPGSDLFGGRFLSRRLRLGFRYRRRPVLRWGRFGRERWGNGYFRFPLFCGWAFQSRHGGYGRRRHRGDMADGTRRKRNDQAGPLLVLKLFVVIIGVLADFGCQLRMSNFESKIVVVIVERAGEPKELVHATRIHLRVGSRCRIDGFSLDDA